MVRNLIGLNRLLPWIPRFKSAEPTVFHLTHYKAGSQWIYRLLQALVPDRVVAPDALHRQFLERPVVAGKVYPTLYLTREQFESVPRPGPHRKFVMIRDLRDTLVSLYFSHLKSHEIMDSWMKARRESLARATEEDGLLLTMENLVISGQIQWSWVATGEPLVKYEDLLTRDEDILADVLLRRCRLSVDPGLFRDAVRRYRFEAFSGRKPGSEDLSSHQRKGVAGDWRNHFTPRLINEFKARYGSLLIATGYEKDNKW
jgi:lipopolysaccharide transport system ATP-binding protein